MRAEECLELDPIDLLYSRSAVFKICCVPDLLCSKLAVFHTCSTLATCRRGTLYSVRRVACHGQSFGEHAWQRSNPSPGVTRGECSACRFDGLCRDQVFLQEIFVSGDLFTFVGPGSCSFHHFEARCAVQSREHLHAIRASRNCVALLMRSSGFFSRHLKMIASTSAGIPA